MDDASFKALLAELVDGQQQAFVLLAKAVADVSGQPALLADRLDHHAATLAHAVHHPMAARFAGAMSQALRAMPPARP